MVQGSGIRVWVWGLEVRAWVVGLEVRSVAAAFLCVVILCLHAACEVCTRKLHTCHVNRPLLPYE
jgi:hypothetical protein